MADIDESSLVTVVCGHCHQELEVSRALLGTVAECPACGAKIPMKEQATPAQLAAMKSRTIRIELADM